MSLSSGVTAEAPKANIRKHVQKALIIDFPMLRSLPTRTERKMRSRYDNGAQLARDMALDPGQKQR